MNKEENTPTINILSTNRDKLQEIENFASNNLEFRINIKILHNLKSLDLHEIQGNEEEIILDKCETAMKKIEKGKINLPHNSCILVEDSSFGIEEMQGLPGPYIRDFFLKLGNKQFYTMVRNYCESDSNIKAVEKCHLAIQKNSQDKILIFEGQCEGEIVEPDNEEKDEYNWAYFFKPKGADKTYGWMTVEEKNKFSARKEALNKLCQYLNENKNYFES